MSEIRWDHEYSECSYMYDDDQLVASIGTQICYRRKDKNGGVVLMDIPEGSTLDEQKALCLTLYRMQVEP